MADHKPDYLAGNESENALPGLEAARAQIAAARVRREVLIAAGRLPGSLSESASIPAKTLPGYALLRELHRGGQGVVYLALQQSTGREVAVKILRQGPLAAPADLARFQREVEVLGRLKHPNIVTIHDCGRAGEDVYLVMDYVAGRPLDEYVRRKVETSKSRKVEIEEVLELFTTVCDGVNAAHLRGVIHRDLKPSNILVVDEASIDKFSRDSKRSAVELPASRSSDESRLNLGEPKILDFGLAKLVADPADGSSAQAMTLTGQFVGSLPWASPEQAEGRSDLLDIRTDVYSLGVILYQLLTGQFPYPVAGRMDEVVRHIAQSSPARPSAVEKSIGHEVETILLKCLAKEPDRRYQSAGELARDIRHYMANEPIEAKRDSMSYVLRKQLRRHWAAVVVVASFALLLAGGLVTSLTLWYRAERALVEKEAQRKLADQRADETQKVAEFQSKMLSNIDVQAAGAGLRERLIAKRRAAMKAGVPDEAEVETELRQFETSLAGVNFTSVALETLDETIFLRALKAVDDQFDEQPLVKAQLLLSLASTLSELDLLNRATAPQTEALDICRRVLGNEDPKTLNAINNMGLLLQHQGKLAEAEVYYREALEGYRRVLGEDDPATLTALDNIGHVNRFQDKRDEAEACYREVLEKRRRVLGDEHPDMIGSLNSMGALLQAQGRMAEAEPYLREAVELSRRVHGNDHRHTLASIYRFGILLHRQGRLAEAEPYCREALEISRRVLGEDHQNTFSAISNFGLLLQAQGKFAEAEVYCREAMEKMRGKFGDENKDTLAAIVNLGLLLNDAGKQDEAEIYLRDGLEKGRRVLGDDHINTLRTINALGSLLQDQGKLEEAEVYYREGLERNRRVNGEAHPSTLSVINNLADLLISQGKLAEAEELLLPAVQAVEQKLPPKMPVRGALTSQLAKLYEKRHAREPGQGYDAKHAEWRAKLDEWRAATQPAAP